MGIVDKRVKTIIQRRVSRTAGEKGEDFWKTLYAHEKGERRRPGRTYR